MKIYLARNPHENDNYQEERWFGEIGIFYDTPELQFNMETRIREWGNARKIGTAPSYMYPTLSPDEYIVLYNEVDHNSIGGCDVQYLHQLQQVKN